MPRATDGTVTLPAGNPVVDGTTISADVHNSTIADLASMIEDSLSRSGYGGMNVPLSFQDGTVSAPGIAFDSDPNTGLYDEAADNPAIAAGGVKAQEWTPTGTTIPGTLAVTGAATASSTLAVTGNATVGGTLGVTGATTLSSLTVSGALNATLTYASLPSPNYSLDTGLFTTGSTTSNTFVNCTDGSGHVLITGTVTSASNRPFLIIIQPNSATNAYRLSAITSEAEFKLVRTLSAVDTDFALWKCAAGDSINSPLVFLNVLAAGSYTFRLMYRSTVFGDTASVQYASIFALEI